MTPIVALISNKQNNLTTSSPKKYQIYKTNPNK